jgi:hypothetical protein
MLCREWQKTGEWRDTMPDKGITESSIKRRIAIHSRTVCFPLHFGAYRGTVAKPRNLFW